MINKDKLLIRYQSGNSHERLCLFYMYRFFRNDFRSIEIKEVESRTKNKSNRYPLKSKIHCNNQIPTWRAVNTEAQDVDTSFQ